MTDTEKRIIKKYPNRRLYDTTQSKYVTLNDIRTLVLEAIPFCIIEKNSGDDITRSILLQIIIEQEEAGEPMFTTDILEQIIGFYGNSEQRMAGDFLRDSLRLFQDQQQKFQAQVADTVKLNPMSNSFAEVTKRNLERWQEMQEGFFQAAGITPNKPAAEDSAPED